jgi:hypothetical protein
MSRPGFSEDEEAGGSLPPGFSYIGLVAGVFALVLGLKSLRQDYQRYDRVGRFSEWESVPASWIQVSVRRDTSGALGEYYPDVLYDYRKEGKSVWGWRYSYEETPQSKEFWERRLSNFKKGDSLTVWIHPRLDGESLVEKQNDGLWGLFFKALAGVAFCLAGTALIGVGGWSALVSWKARRALG